MSSSDENLPSTSSYKRHKTEPKTYNQGRRGERFKSKKLKTAHRNVPDVIPAHIFDNGAYTIKVGPASAEEPMLIPNCIMKGKSEKKRLFIGNQVDDCRDLSGLFYLRPCERGYITKWDIQKTVWDYVFSKNVCPFNKEDPIVMTQPLLNFKNIEECTDEIFFEEYEVKSLYKANPTDFAYFEFVTKTVGHDVPAIIVDSGFSYTHIVPYINGKKYSSAVKRINVGGKFLTNVLREMISYRMYDVMEETHVINQVKEDACFICDDINEALNISKLPGNENTIVRNYVLPDFHTLRRGYIQDTKSTDDAEETRQILRLNNERFAVPEILFKPSDIEMKASGLGETLLKCIQKCPPNVQRVLCKNIIVIGGNANFSGFKNRLFKEMRPNLPQKWDINIFIPENPIIYAWQGAKGMSQTSEFKNLVVTKEQYSECGSNYTRSKFNNQWISDITDTSRKANELENLQTPKNTSNTRQSISGRPTISSRATSTAVTNKPSTSSFAVSCNKTINEDKNQAEIENIDNSNTAVESSKKKACHDDNDEAISHSFFKQACDLGISDYFKRSYI